MRAVTLLALWFTVYGNINKTWKKCHDMQLSCIDRLNNLSPILIGVNIAIGANFTRKSFQLTFTRENQ